LYLSSVFAFLVSPLEMLQVVLLQGSTEETAIVTRTLVSKKYVVEPDVPSEMVKVQSVDQLDAGEEQMTKTNASLIHLCVTRALEAEQEWENFRNYVHRKPNELQ